MRCPTCEGSGEVERAIIPKTCSTCEGKGEFELDPVTRCRLPMVERMEIGRFYVNHNGVYTHPLTLVETSRGLYAVKEMFYRPGSWRWILRSHEALTGRRLEPNPLRQKGSPWIRVVSLPVSYLRCDRHNPTWEIEWADWKRALDDPKIWQTPPPD